MDIPDQINELKLKNDFASLLEQGWLYATGPAGICDYQQATACFDAAYKARHSNALVGLGLIYYKGDGVKPDYVQSRLYFDKAVEQGSVKDKACFEKAVAMGYADAMYQLGKLLERSSIAKEVKHGKKLS